MIIIFFCVIAVLAAENNANLCTEKETCAECIQEFGCAWCITPLNTGDLHCYNTSENKNYKCAENLTIDPKSSFEIIKNEPLQLSPNKEAVQVQPQYLKLKLRKGETRKLYFQYGQAKNLPIDLYYIMDLSNSMKEHKRILSQVGNSLINVMRNISSNFRIGFGSFVDKTTAPFISLVPEKINKPCAGCVKAYSFQNHMSLSDGQHFSHNVASAQLSGNLDIPEGGFDGLMQAMVCQEEIGWRENARKLIVFSTDAPFHIAGDGKLAGIVIPNDAKCHLENNMYTHDLILDYPSVSHINYIARENHFNILFAVTESNLAIYERLMGVLENSRVVTLSKDTKLPEVVQDFYYKVTNNLRMTYKASKNIDVSFTLNCSNATENGCKDVRIGDIINFSVHLKALDCLTENKELVTIQASNLNKKITIEVSVDCECDCKDTRRKSEQCNLMGTFKCGICECYEGYSGQQCECNISQEIRNDTKPSCKRDNDTLVCSGLGVCRCGACQCHQRSNPNERIYGKYCQCDNYSCAKSDGLLCGGNGNCDCGICKCNAQWTGDACDCPSNNETCTLQDSICNNRGACVCGACKCDSGYYGKFCEECGNCQGGKCSELKPCVECKVHQIGIYREREICNAKCANYDIKSVDSLQQGTYDESAVKTCRLGTDNYCFMTFNYTYDANERLVIIAENKLNCAEPLNPYKMMGSIIGAIVVIGILTAIIWRAITYWHDKREYENFENERNQARWNVNENPLFRTPVNNFQNPTFGRKSFIEK